MSGELEKCRNCGSECDPKGWMRGDGAQGPECEGCGITAPDVESWNRLMRTQLASTGGEAVEVVAWADENLTAFIDQDCKQYGEKMGGAAGTAVGAHKTALMTVAQHNRIVAAMQPAPAGVVVPREWTEFLSELHSHLDNIAEFDPSYPGDTMPRNTSAELLVSLRALLNQAGVE